MIKYTRNEGYARRGHTPRRRCHTPARPLSEPGQLQLGQFERAQLVDLAVKLYMCPACHEPIGQQCTRPPQPREVGRQPLKWMCHAERYELVTADDIAEHLIENQGHKSA